MVGKGMMLRLHEKGLHRVEDIYFKITEESGTWMALVKITDLDKNETSETPAYMIEELLRSGDLYPPEQEELMTRYHNAVKKRKEAKND